MKDNDTIDLGPSIIDNYHYCRSSDRDKINYYQNHKLTKEEQEKTNSLIERLKDFEEKVRGKEYIDLYLKDPEHPEWRIKYFEDKGYISIVNADYDIVDIYYYGRSENEAFLNAVVAHELLNTIRIELYNREDLNKEYSNRFLNGEVTKDDYHGPFFFSELALQDFRKFYGNDIPKRIIKNYENHVNSIYEDKYEYSFDLNRFIFKQNEKIMTK